MKYTPRLKEKWAINLRLKKDILIEQKCYSHLKSNLKNVSNAQLFFWIKY